MNYSATGTGGTPRHPWDQLPGEPDRQYARFQFYLDLGPLRTAKEAARRVGLEKRNKPYHSGGRWADMSRAWHWRERALAWDAEQRALLGLSERNMRLGLRRKRVAVMEDMLERVRTALDTARIDEADQKQARKWLGDLRQFLCDLLTLERLEFEGSSEEQWDSPVITADDLRAAQRRMEEDARRRGDGAADAADAADAGAWPAFRTVSQPVSQLRGLSFGPGEAFPKERGKRRSPPTDVLVFGRGADDASVTVEMWREVRAAGGLQFGRVRYATQKQFADVVHLGQGLKTPAKFMHVALAASAEGIEFSDGCMGGPWLRKRLTDLQVLLLARYCGGDDPAWAQDVPCVITVAAGGDAGELAAFARAFWIAIGEGEEVGAALEAARAGAPGVRAGMRG